MIRSPAEEARSRRIISRRALILTGGQLGFMGVLALRMRQLQLLEADKYRTLAEENRINIRLIPPARGLIFDRNGVLIAGNEQNYRITIVREDTPDIERTLREIAALIPMSAEDLERARRELRRNSPFVPVSIAERLSWEDLSRIAVNAPALPGVSPEVGLSRIYPLVEDFSHVVGYVGPASDYDLKRLNDPDPLLKIPRFQIGKIGVEAKLEKLLRGKAGSRRIEVNAQGRVMRELDRIEGTPGADIQLTIDARLQNFIHARLAGESAAAVVIDTGTGDILASCSAPGFDPNKFVRGISVPDYRALTEDAHRPLADKSVQGTYPPGSTFKIVVALAALEEGLLEPEETVYCPGYLKLGNRRFHCWKRGGHGKVNLLKSLQQSCDVFYYEMAQRVGIEKITAMARRLGLGQKHKLPMSGIAAGLTPTKDWKRSRYGREWLVGDTLNSGIGQGYVLASPLQLALMTARVASGRRLAPRLIRTVNGVAQKAPPAPPLDIDPRHLQLVREGMFAVSNSRRGTAWRSRIADESMRLAGKTGTSQVRNITKAEREAGVTRNEDLPWERRDHALFVAFAPADAPKIAVSVVVEHGGGGSKAAAPIARDIVLRALSGGMPPLEAYPPEARARARETLENLQLRKIETGRHVRLRART